MPTPRTPRTPKPPAPTESEITRSITDWFTSLGARCWYFKVKGGGFAKGGKQKTGVPDLISVIDGVTYFIEVKTKKGTLEDSQEREFPKIVQAGANLLVARSLDDVITHVVMNEHKRESEVREN